MDIFGNRTLRAGLMGAAATVAISGSAWAQTKTFDIPAQPASAAVAQFARQADVQVLVSGSAAGSRQTSALRGAYTIDDGLSRMLAGTGLAAKMTGPQTYTLVIAGPPGQGGAAPQDPPASLLDEVTVTATRLGSIGFVAPTPTTVLTSTDLQFAGATNLGAALATLPSYAPTVTQATTRNNVTAGQNSANLRDLGATRTLVLIDGARPVTTLPGGAAFAFDLNMVPFYLVDHVEVVTGGASAQWGSDAVAGVINIVMKKSLDGVQAHYQVGSDTEGYGSLEQVGDIAAGTSFAGGRGQVMVGAGYDKVGSVFPAALSAFGRSGLIPNPGYTATNGQPQALFATGIVNSNLSVGGLINAGPLKGTNFGPGGVTSPFQYGQDATATGTLMVGGDPSARNASGPYQALIVPLVRENIYGRASYELSDHVRLTFDALLGREESQEPLGQYSGTATIQSTNAYLPASILAAMSANKITSFTLGRIDEDFGESINRSVNKTEQFKLGANGDLRGSWTWDAFYSYGETDRSSSLSNQPITANLNNAVNAVKSPTTGQPVCAIALTNPSTSCVPIDLLGPGNATPAALAYIMGSSVVSTTLYQHEAAANLRGEPFSTWAGPVSMAGGLEFRKEGVDTLADPLTQAKALGLLNIAVLTPGSYTVEEAYLEAAVPLARDLPAMQKLDFDGAVRESHYSTSGTIASWKVGLTDRVTDELLLRGSVSRDIRAPNLNELLTGQTTSVGTVVNPLTNVSYSNVHVYGGGNPDLLPETSKTYTFGVVYTPKYFENLRISLDYYNIDITNAIASLASTTILSQCYIANVANACSDITTVNGAITAIQSTYINFSSYRAGGADFEADYNIDLARWNMPGQLSAKWLATYVNLLKQVSGTTTVRLADDIQQASPRWRSNFMLDYKLNDVDFDARARYVGGGNYTNSQVVDTTIKGQVYVDMGVKWKLPTSRNLSVYADVNNVFNNVYLPGAVAQPALFDYIGRTYDVGLRVAF